MGRNKVGNACEEGSEVSVERKNSGYLIAGHVRLGGAKAEVCQS